MASMRPPVAPYRTIQAGSSGPTIERRDVVEHARPELAPTTRGPERGRRRGLGDVARLAGVGLATVDRVLNERGGVADSTARRVIEAAREIGLRRTLPVPYVRTVRLEVLLPKSATPFLLRLSQSFTAVAATLDRSVIVQRSILDETRPRSIARHILASAADGLILFCQEEPSIVEAIAAVGRSGRPVICLGSDIPGSSRSAYVGIDHAKAGRTAGFFAAKLSHGSGAVLVVTTSLGYRAHRERLEGFKEGLHLYAPGMPIADILQGHDDHDRVYCYVRNALRRRSDIAAIYNTGGVNRAVAAGIREAGQAGRIVFVGHELTDRSTVLLQEGVMTLTIDQAPEMQARRAIDVLLRHVGSINADFPTKIPFTLHTRENI